MSKDTVYRQDAVDAILKKPAWHNSDGSYYHSSDIKDALEGLPSAQPEIIRCKSCRHDNNCEIQYAAQAGSEFFCGAAERREE